MFALEFTSNRPAGSAPYYSLVIREEPYTIGCLPVNDIFLSCHDISPQHAKLEVMRQKYATPVDASATERADEIRSEHEEEIDPALQDPTFFLQPQGDGEEEEEDPNIAAEAATLAVEANGNCDGEEVLAAAGGALTQASRRPQKPQQRGPVPLLEEDPLVVRLTALPTKGEGAILVNGCEVAPGDSVVLQNGSEVQLSSEVAVVFRFRPLVVGIESTAFTKEYTRDLVYMFRRLGATLCNVISGPTSNLSSIPTPIALLHCVEELNDSKGCVVALACGYSVVQPTYVFEWFAALAQCPSQPLSVLPPPSRFEVPTRVTLHPRSTMYIRPESDTCPFSLYPIPSTAMRKRNRAELFAQRTFYFASQSSAEKYMDTLVQCGGQAYGPADVEAAKAALRGMSAGQPHVGLPLNGQEEPPNPSNYYIIVDNGVEATMLNHGLRIADPGLCKFIEDISALGATHVPILGDHSLFTSLLSNSFAYEPIQYSVDPPVVITPLPIPHRALSASEGYQLYTEDHSGDAGVGSAGAGVQRGPQQPVSPSSAAAAAAAARRNSLKARNSGLLPLNRSRTPSRSQMRSASRQRQRSSSAAMSEAVEPNAQRSASMQSSSRGRRHLVRGSPQSVNSGAASQLSMGSRFDILRIRVYAFLVREEPQLDTATTVFRRHHYVDDAVAERALEIKAQAEDYMEQVDQLLDEGGYGPYTDSLRRFWRDCSDLSVKAGKVLSSFGKQSCSRRPSARRTSSTCGSRNASSSREGNEIFEGSSSSNNHHAVGGGAPAPVAQDSAAAVVPPSSARTGSRPNTPRVREHRDAYLSLGGQRMSLSASQNSNHRLQSSSHTTIPQQQQQQSTPRDSLPNPKHADPSTAPDALAAHSSSVRPPPNTKPEKQPKRQTQTRDSSAPLRTALANGHSASDPPAAIRTGRKRKQ